MNSWIGLQRVEESSAEEYLAEKERSYWVTRKWLRFFFWLLVVLWPYVIYRSIAESDFERIISPTLFSMFLFLQWKYGPQEHADVMRTERLYRSLTLLSDRVSDITKDNLGRVIKEEQNVYWTFLKGFEEKDDTIEMRFSEKPKTYSLPKSIFPDDVAKDEFLSFLKGTIIRCGKRPKEHWLRAP